MDERSLSERIDRLSQVVGELNRKIDFILKELKLEYHEEPNPNVPPQYAKIYALMKQGKKLEAIKEYRTQFGGGLDLAQAAVERIAMGLPPL